MTMRSAPLLLTSCLVLCIAALAMHARASDELPRSEEAMLELLPPTFRVEETRRFTVYTDANPAWLATQRQLLERTHHQVARFARRMGWEVPGRIPKQTVVLFAKRADYVAFAREHDDVTADWVAGYFSPGNRWVVFYDIESSPSLLDARSRLDEMKSELRTLQRESASGRAHDHGSSMATMVEHYENHLHGEQNRVEQFVEQVSIATTVHEATHQLLYAFGIQRAGVPYPFWLSEGLATNFETDNVNSAYGPDFECESRRQAFQKAVRTGSTLPFEQFILTGDSPQIDANHADLLYSQAYAFFRWAYRFRRDELQSLFIRYGEQPGAEGALPSGRLSADAHRDEFERAFGPIEKIESEWLSWERANTGIRVR